MDPEVFLKTLASDGYVLVTPPMTESDVQQLFHKIYGPAMERVMLTVLPAAAAIVPRPSTQTITLRRTARRPTRLCQGARRHPVPRRTPPPHRPILNMGPSIPNRYYTNLHNPESPLVQLSLSLSLSGLCKAHGKSTRSHRSIGARRQLVSADTLAAHMVQPAVHAALLVWLGAHNKRGPATSRGPEPHLRMACCRSFEDGTSVCTKPMPPFHHGPLRPSLTLPIHWTAAPHVAGPFSLPVGQSVSAVLAPPCFTLFTISSVLFPLVPRHWATWAPSHWGWLNAPELRHNPVRGMVVHSNGRTVHACANHFDHTVE
jgi:hypothetical protein